MVLYRPVGHREYELIRDRGFASFPPRLPTQPIFYPVLNIEYARQIASEWNATDPSSGYRGYVLRFVVEDAYLAASRSRPLVRAGIRSIGFLRMN